MAITIKIFRTIACIDNESTYIPTNNINKPEKPKETRLNDMLTVSQLDAYSFNNWSR